MTYASPDDRGAQAFSLRLPPDLAKALRDAAQENERSQGAQIRHVLREALETHQKAKS
jgi:hypothetical protein